MANVGSLGGINIQFGADLGEMNRALRGLEGDLKEFARDLGKISLDGVMKGDPFSATKRYFKETTKQIDKVYEDWKDELRDFDHSMNRSTERARENAIKITKAFKGMSDDSKAYIDSLAKEYVRLGEMLPKITNKELGIIGGGKTGRGMDLKKVYSKDFRDTLSLFRGFSKEANDILDKLIKGSKAQTGLTIKGVNKYLRDLRAAISRAKSELSFDDPRFSKMSDALREAYALQEKLQGRATFNEESKAAGSREEAEKRRLNKLRAIRLQEKDLLADQRLGIDVQKQLVALYDKKLALGVRLTKSQQARRFDTGEEKQVEQMKELSKLEKKLLSDKRRGVNVEEELEDLLERKFSLQGKINRSQQLRSPAAADSFARAEQDRLLKLKQIEDTEKRLLMAQAAGENKEKEIVALYQKKLRLGGELTKQQQARMPNAEKEILKVKEEMRRAEKDLLDKRKAGLNVDQQLLSLYRRQKGVGLELNEFQKKRVNEIERGLQLERNVAAEAAKSAKAQKETVQIGKSTRRESELGLRLEELMTAEDKKQERIATRAQKMRKKKYAQLKKERQEKLRIARAEAGGQIYTNEKELMAALRYEVQKAEAIKLQNKEKERQAKYEKRAAERATRILNAEREREDTNRRISELKRGKQEFSSERELMANIRAEQNLAKAKKRNMEYANTEIAIKRRATKEAEKHRVAIKRLTAEIEHEYNVEANRVEILRRLQAIQRTGTRLTDRETRALKRATAAKKASTRAEKSNTRAFSLGNILKPSRIAWFVQLRLLWAAYQAIGEGARDMVEAHTQLSRALRTARSSFKTTTQVAKSYHNAMRSVVRLHGVGWEEAGEVLYQLGSAGLSAEESLAALHSTTSLIVATEGDARETTKAIAGIYNNYADEIENATTQMEKFEHISDLVATAWSEHQVEISELTDGYKQAIAMTKAAGLSLNDLTAILAVANDHMIKGGRAGRALQNVFMRISRAPVQFQRAFGLTMNEFDAGKPLDFVNIMDMLSKKMHDGSLSAFELSRNFERLGLRGGPVFTTLLQNWNKVEKAMLRFNDVSGKAKELEEIRLDNLASTYQKFLGTLKDVVQSLSPILRQLQRLMQGIMDYWNKSRGAAIEKGFLAGTVEATADNLARLEEKHRLQSKAVEKEQKYREYLNERHLETLRRQGKEEVDLTYEQLGALTKAAAEKATYGVASEGYNPYGSHVAAADAGGDIAEQMAAGYKAAWDTSMKKSDLVEPDIPDIDDLGLADTYFETGAVIAQMRRDLGVFVEEVVDKERGRADDPLSTLKSEAQKRVERFMVENEIGDISKFLEIDGDPREIFAGLDLSDVGNEFVSIVDNMVSARDRLTKFDTSEISAITLAPSMAIESADAAKKLLYYKKLISQVDSDIALKEKDMLAAQKIADQYTRKSGDESRSAHYANIEKFQMKEMNDLQQERNSLEEKMLGILNDESNNLEDSLTAIRQMYKAQQKGLTAEIAKAKLLGITAQEEADITALIWKRYAKQLDEHALTESIGILRSDISDGEKEDLKRKRIASDLASKEAKDAAILLLHKERTNSLQKEYNMLMARAEAVYNKTAKTYERENATVKETLKLRKNDNRIRKEILANEITALRKRAKDADLKEQIVINKAITDARKKYTALLAEEADINEEIKIQSSVIYDIWRRMEDRAKDINSWWHDIADTFTMGMVNGLAGMWTSWISGSQEAQQEIINLNGEIESLEQQADAIREKGIFSYEEAQNLQNINEEIEELNDQIDDLEDPLKQAEDQFKNFFKALIDEINAAIARMIIMRAIMLITGMATNTGGGSLPAGDYNVPTTTLTAASGGVLPRMKSFKKFGQGGITSNPMMAILGDNPSGKELVIPAENIAKDNVSGYAQEAKQPINVVNVLSKEDIAAAMASKEGERVVINLIGRDLNNNGPIARRLNI